MHGDEKVHSDSVCATDDTVRMQSTPCGGDARGNAFGIEEREVLVNGGPATTTAKTYRWEGATSSSYIKILFIDDKVFTKEQKGLK